MIQWKGIEIASSSTTQRILDDFYPSEKAIEVYKWPEWTKYELKNRLSEFRRIKKN